MNRIIGKIKSKFKMNHNRTDLIKSKEQEAKASFNENLARITMNNFK